MTTERPTRAELHGGPLDGQTRAIADDADHLDVTMADDTRHRYDRTGRIAAHDDDDPVTVYQWVGLR